MRTIVTSVPKAKGRREYGVAARGRAAKARHRGRSSLCATGLFRSGREFCPGCFDFHVGGSIVGQMVFGLTPRSAGRMKKPLVKVRLASGFSYVGYQSSVDGADLVDEPRAVEIVQLGADGVGRFAVDHADEQATKQRYLARYLSGPFSFIWRL